MADYEQLIKALRFCSSQDNCIGCPEKNNKTHCIERIMSQAANAIEELKCEISQLKKKADLANVDQLQTLIHQTENALLFPAPPAPQRPGPTYIVSQNGSIIIKSDECASLELAPIDRSRVLAYRDFNDYYLLGTYRNEDVAKTALSGLLFALEGQVSVYQMPKDPPPDAIPAWSETVKPC